MMTLNKKDSVLGYDNAYHLLRRTTYNITKSRIKEFALLTPSQAIDVLFNFSEPIPPRPLNANKETIIPTIAYPTISDTLNTNDGEDFDKYWWMYQAMKDNSAQYRITFWLHLLFITDDDFFSYANLDYRELLRFHSKGSLKDLALRMTFNPRMLIYLGNTVNKKNSPNQNYAREFLELFTILKGSQIGTGNYTNYTEADVQLTAKVFTGITTNGATWDKFTRLQLVDPITKISTGYINPVNHDTTNKTFSSAFGNATITGGTTEATIKKEVEDFISMVFNQDETAKAYCRRMYRYFVGRTITSEIETGIITPLAAKLKENKYQILPTLRELLSSKHFYDEEDSVSGDQVIGSLVRSPIEIYFHLFSLLNFEVPLYQDNPASIHKLMLNIVYTNSLSLGVQIFRPQSVNGYSGYTESPNYDKNFITTSSLRIRYNNTIDLLITGFNYNNYIYKLNLPQFVKSSGYFTDPSNATALVSDFCSILHIEVPTGEKLSHFLSIFLGGLSPINWKNDWNTFASSNVATTVKIPIDRLAKALVKSPEFQVF